MKKLLIIYLILLAATSFAQISKSGTYTYSYCDEEYNKCIDKCKVIIKGNKIWIYAPANLTNVKKGELFESGTLYKHVSGKWIIIHNKDKRSIKTLDKNNNPFSWVDFKRKRYWTF